MKEEFKKITLHEQTLLLAKAYAKKNEGKKNAIQDLCDKADVEKRWFYRFINDEIPDPSVNRIERLNEQLTN